MLRAADALDRYAARREELSATADRGRARRLRLEAAQYYQAAAGYRELAARPGPPAKSRP